MKKAVRKTVNAVGFILVGFILLCTVFILFSNISGNISFLGGYTFMWVKTESMEPSIPAQSYILVKKVNVKEIKTDDVIVFYSDDPSIKGMLNTHRVAEIIGDHKEFVTRGDNNMRLDEYTAKAEKVIGVYKSNLPLLSALGRVLATTVGKIVVFTAIFAIMMIIYVPDIKKAKKEKAEELKRLEKERIDELVKAEVERLKAENNASAQQTEVPSEAEQKDAPSVPDNAEKTPAQSESAESLNEDTDNK